jgi:hypothetical protein
MNKQMRNRKQDGIEMTKREKLRHFFNKKSVKIVSIVIIVLLVVGAGVGGFFLLQDRAQFDVDLNGDVTEFTKDYSPLTGVTTSSASVKRPITAVMIENSPDARPQSGLAYDNVVFEAVAEGGITRFIVLYQEAQPELIGPVRSVRPYYLEWARPFEPAVAHVGGSDRALQMVRSGSYGVDIDQFFNASSYWRANDRYAPHNVYTSMKDLYDLGQSKGHTASTFAPWARADEQKAEIPEYTTIEMDVSSGVFAVSYNYDAENNTYLRILGGQPHVDREKGQIAPKVVIALMVNSAAAEDASHNNFVTTGSNTCYIFQNGTVVEATWSRADTPSMLKFTDTAGEEITLNRGQTWITAVQNGRNVSWE